MKRERAKPAPGFSEAKFETDRSHPYTVGFIDIEPVRLGAEAQVVTDAPLRAQAEREVLSVVGVDQHTVDNRVGIPAHETGFTE